MAGRVGAARPAGYGWRGLTVWPPRAAAESLLRRKLAKDVLFLQISNVFQKSYGFFFSVAAVRLLGKVHYGEFILVLTLYQTVNLLGSLGLGQFLVVPLAQAAAAGDRAEVAQASGYNLKLSALVGLLVMAVALAFGPWFGEGIHRPDLGHLMRIVALGGLPAVGYNVATTALQALRRMRDLAIVENVDAVLERVLPLVAVFGGFGLPGILWGTTIGSSLSAVFALYLYHRIAVRRHGFPGFRQLAVAAWRVPFRRYFRFSALAVVDKNVAQFFGQTPLLFLGRWAGPEQVTYFTIAAKVFTAAAAMHGAASKAFSVRLSQELGRHGPPAARRLFWKITLAWGAISAAVVLGFLLCLPIFRWLYTPDNLPSFLLVVIFGLLQAKQGLTVSLGSIFLIMNRVATNVLVKLPLMAVFLPIGVLLVQRLGATGAALYQLLAYVAGDVAYFAIIATPWFWRGAARRPVPPAP